MERTFSPEFRNRLDAIVSFRSLGQETMLRIVDKFISELRLRLNDRQVVLKISPAARSFLARRGYDPIYGARPLARLIQNEVSDVIAHEVLFGHLADGGTVKVGCRQDRLTFRYQ